MKKLGIVVGARPNFVKAAAVIRALRDAALRNELGRRGRFAAETVYDRSKIAAHLDSFLRRLI